MVISALEPVQARYAELIQDKKYLESVLKSGAGEAQKRAYKIWPKSIARRDLSSARANCFTVQYSTVFAIL